MQPIRWRRHCRCRSCRCLLRRHAPRPRPLLPHGHQSSEHTAAARHRIPGGVRGRQGAEGQSACAGCALQHCDPQPSCLATPPMLRTSPLPSASISEMSSAVSPRDMRMPSSFSARCSCKRRARGRSEGHGQLALTSATAARRLGRSQAQANTASPQRSPPTPPARLVSRQLSRAIGVKQRKDDSHLAGGRAGWGQDAGMGCQRLPPGCAQRPVPAAAPHPPASPAHLLAAALQLLVLAPGRHGARKLLKINHAVLL